jgi:hypothetical protein
MKFFFFVLLFFPFCSYAQEYNEIQISFEGKVGAKKLELNDNFILIQDTFQISVLKFYVSNITLLLKDETVWQNNKQFYLVDFENNKNISLQLPKNVTDYDVLKFNLGIDSTTNVAGVLGGDLDPTKGMYWTWQSGYINFKIEGTSSQSPTRNNEFIFHIGGYKSPNNPLQTIELKLEEHMNTIHIQFDLESFFSQINLKELNQIMSPSKNAVELAKVVKNVFSISK